jgi:regulator of replication initiation timing
VRIKENNMLKRENEELKNRIKNLLEEKNELEEKIIISPS